MRHFAFLKTMGEFLTCHQQMPCQDAQLISLKLVSLSAICFKQDEVAGT